MPSINFAHTTACHQQRTALEIIRALLHTLALRAPATAAHSRRVADLALSTARALGCAEHEIAIIGCGALLHKLGMIGIPDRILYKPVLTAAEWAMIHRYPDRGADLLAPWPELAPAAEIVRARHERYDGTGYAHGLCGEAIPRGARIVAVVAAYAAMTDQRVYRATRSHHGALTELQRCAGGQFDPEIVRVFCALMTKGADRCARYA